MGRSKDLATGKITGNANDADGNLKVSTNTPANYPAMVIETSTGGNSTEVHGLHIKNTAAGHGLRIDDEASDTTPFVVASDGKAGIGTTSPLRSLHVSSAGDTGLMLQTTNAVDDKEIWEIQSAADGSNHANLIIRTRVNAGTGGAEAMRINNNGVVTIPNQPCAVWGHSTNYTLTQDSSWRDVALNTTVFDKANNYSTSTYRFTAPVAGVYLVGFSGEFHSTSNTVWSYLVPRINGSNTANLSNKGNYMADFSTSGTYSVHHQTWFLNLAANDYFVFSHIGSGGNLTLRGISEAQFFATLLG